MQRPYLAVGDEVLLIPSMREIDWTLSGPALRPSDHRDRGGIRTILTAFLGRSSAIPMTQSRKRSIFRSLDGGKIVRKVR